MKNGRMMGLITGAAMGAAAMAVFGMMNRGTQRKVGRLASESAHKLATKADQMFK